MAWIEIARQHYLREGCATSSPTQRATWSACRSIPPTFRTATAPLALGLNSQTVSLAAPHLAEGGYAGDKLKTALAHFIAHLRRLTRRIARP